MAAKKIAGETSTTSTTIHFGTRRENRSWHQEFKLIKLSGRRALRALDFLLTGFVNLDFFSSLVSFSSPTPT